MTTTSTQAKSQITAAIGAHGMWKARLLNAIDTGKCDCDEAKAGRDDQCDFGKWLHTTIDAGLKGDPLYGKVKLQHATFHQVAAKVLGLALRGKTVEAQQAVDGDYAKVSAELVRLLSEWKKA